MKKWITASSYTHPTRLGESDLANTEVAFGLWDRGREIPKGEVLLAGAKKLEKAILCVMGMNGTARAVKGQVKNLTVA